MPSQKKIQTVKEILKDIESHSVVGIVNMHKLPGKQLNQIKRALSKKAKVRMAKKSLIKIALSKAKKDKVKDLEAVIQGSPAMLFSNSNPFELAGFISSSKSKTAASPGDISPLDIFIPSGPTSIPAGPAIGELQKAGLPVGVEGGKIAVKKDTVIVKKGAVISKEVAPVLAKLGIEPMEIGLDLVAVWDNGLIFSKDVLFIPKEKYLEDFKSAFIEGLNLSVKVNYYTSDNIDLVLSKAHKEGYGLAIKVGYMTKDTIKPILARAYAESTALNKMIEKQGQKSE